MSLGEMGFFKTHDEKQWWHYFRIRTEDLRCSVCIGHHFAITSYVDEIGFQRMLGVRGNLKRSYSPIPCYGKIT